MNWAVWVIIGWAVVVAIAAPSIYFQYKANLGKRDYLDKHVRGYVVGGVLLGVMALGGTLPPVVQAIANHMTAISCSNWGRANNRPTKYVVYNFWSTDCVTPSGGGHWISTSSISANNVTVAK